MRSSRGFAVASLAFAFAAALAAALAAVTGGAQADPRLPPGTVLRNDTLPPLLEDRFRYPLRVPRVHNCPDPAPTGFSIDPTPFALPPGARPLATFAYATPDNVAHVRFRAHIQNVGTMGSPGGFDRNFITVTQTGVHSGASSRALRTSFGALAPNARQTFPFELTAPLPRPGMPTEGTWRLTAELSYSTRPPTDIRVSDCDMEDNTVSQVAPLW